MHLVLFLSCFCHLAWSAEEAGERIGRLDYQDACSFGRLRLRTRWKKGVVHLLVFFLLWDQNLCNLLVFSQCLNCLPTWQGQEKESGRGQQGRRNRCRQEGEAERPSSSAFPAPSCNRAHRLCARGGDPEETMLKLFIPFKLREIKRKSKC